MRVAFCCPTITRPFDALLDALEQACPVLDAAGIEHKITFEVGSTYISYARANALRRAMDWGADAYVFLDHDMSFRPQDLIRLIETPGDVVAGTYRFKSEPEQYMGTWRTDDAGYPEQRDDGCIRGEWVPAGFLKVTAQALRDVMESYPGLVFGQHVDPERPSIDLFNHGAHEGVWYGEDYAFSRRWNDRGGEIWIIPDLHLTHHEAGGKAYPGNLKTYLRRQPGGDLAEAA